MTRSRGRLRASFAVLLAAGALGSGCNNVLGIGAATEDPTVGLGGDAGTGTGTSALSCDAYCDAIMANCTGANLEYLTRDVCTAMCGNFDLGTPGDTSGNSLACRTYHAGAALNAPAVHCRHAGPLGGGTCGPNPCVPYCALDTFLCGKQPTPPFAGGETACQTECTKFQYQGTGDDSDITGHDSGDTLNCRLYHLESAYNPASSGAVAFHCPHTATVSTMCF